ALQANIADTSDWTQQSLHDTVRRMAYLTLESAMKAGEPHPKLILWPEAPAPFYYYEDADFRNQLVEVARLKHTDFLYTGVAHDARRPVNSAIMLTPSGDHVARYDKVNLVPFGEFVPSWFTIVKKISSEAGNFQPGEKIVVFPATFGKVGAFI